MADLKCLRDQCPDYWGRVDEYDQLIDENALNDVMDEQGLNTPDHVADSCTRKGGCKAVEICFRVKEAQDA